MIKFDTGIEVILKVYFISKNISLSLSLNSTPLNFVNVKKSMLSREIYYGHIKCVICPHTFFGCRPRLDEDNLRYQVGTDM